MQPLNVGEVGYRFTKSWVGNIHPKTHRLKAKAEFVGRKPKLSSHRVGGFWEIFGEETKLASLYFTRCLKHDRFDRFGV